MNSKRLSIISMTVIVFSLLFALFSFSSGAESEGLYTYTVKNGEATVIACDSTASGTVTVPEALGGYPVAYIRDGAFDGCSEITEIIIPSSLKELGTVNPDITTAKVTTAPVTTLPVTTAPVTTVPAVTTNNGWTKPIKSIKPTQALTFSSEVTSGIFKDCSALTVLTVLAPDCIINESNVKLSQSVLICGYTLSSAKSFADKNGNAFFDLNCDTLHGYYAGAFGENYETVFFVNKENGLLTVKGTGNIPDYSAHNESPWKLYGSEILSLSFSEGITAIGDYAFCSLNIESLVIPESITEIGENAFASCLSLEKVTAESKTPATINETAFSDCTSLKSITVPAGYAPDYKTANGWAAYSDIIFPEFVYGDATGDGKVNALDVLIMRKYLANFDYETNTSTVSVEKGADANGNGDINASDLLLLRKYVANFDYDTNTSSVVLGPQK